MGEGWVAFDLFAETSLFEEIRLKSFGIETESLQNIPKTPQNTSRHPKTPKNPRNTTKPHQHSTER